MRYLSFALALVLYTPVHVALAQSSPSPTALHKIIQVLQVQRNQAADQAADAETRAALLADENAKLKAELEELKKANGGEDAKQKP